MAITLGQDVCPAEDDAGNKCTNLMTQEEQQQDGMCSRCANLMWEWVQGVWANEDPEFLFNKVDHNDG